MQRELTRLRTYRLHWNLIFFRPKRMQIPRWNLWNCCHSKRSAIFLHKIPPHVGFNGIFFSVANMHHAECYIEISTKAVNDLRYSFTLQKKTSKLSCKWLLDQFSVIFFFQKFIFICVRASMFNNDLCASQFHKKQNLKSNYICQSWAKLVFFFKLESGFLLG